MADKPTREEKQQFLAYARKCPVLSSFRFAYDEDVDRMIFLVTTIDGSIGRVEVDGDDLRGLAADIEITPPNINPEDMH